MLDPAAWTWVEKAGVVSLLAGNIAALITTARFAFKSLQEKKWVPGWAYDEMVRERDRLRIENDAYRDVTLRAIRVTDRIVGSEREA
jgi:hypothetical protein